ncbi:MAG: hypothetical protein INQ03_05355 [Candidatus Heimdallarchaeota archaeon]|nr:hypothetical protein [Candidatus Heimdallarchaeota archaeon]
MRKGKAKHKSREPAIARTVFYTALLVEILKFMGFRTLINEKLLVFYPILIIFFSLAFTLAYSDNFISSITNMLVGFTLYFSLTYSLVLFGTIGLMNDSTQVIEGLSRIATSLFTIWKLHSDIRHVSLTLKPGMKKPFWLFQPFYGILWPRREFARLLKIIIHVSITFIFLTSGLELLNQSNVNPGFLDQTTRISNNILLIGLQTPLLMASRSSISRTFSNFLDNYAELVAQYQNDMGQLNIAINSYLDVKSLSYSQINNNGKHLWLTVIIIFFLETFKEDLITLYETLDLGFLPNLIPLP